MFNPNFIIRVPFWEVSFALIPIYPTLTAKHRFSALPPEFLIQQVWEGLGICIPNQCPGGATAAGPESSLENASLPARGGSLGLCPGGRKLSGRALEAPPPPARPPSSLVGSEGHPLRHSAVRSSSRTSGAGTLRLRSGARRSCPEFL